MTNNLQYTTDQESESSALVLPFKENARSNACLNASRNSTCATHTPKCKK